MLSNIDNKTIKNKYLTLIDGDCLVSTIHAGGQMKFPADLNRYAVADAVVARELAGTPVPDLSAVPPLERRKPPDPPSTLPVNASKSDKARYEKARNDFDEAESVRALDEYGECVVRTAPSGARALLLTRPESSAEAGRFDALRDAFGQCLPEGRTLILASSSFGERSL